MRLIAGTVCYCVIFLIKVRWPKSKSLYDIESKTVIEKSKKKDQSIVDLMKRNDE